jgi:hypothetical protein
LSRVVVTGVVVTGTIVAAACATSKAEGPPAGRPPPPEATSLAGAEPVALRTVDAPGQAVDILTARLRDAFARTSGVPVVDQVSVRAEIAACVVAPCAEELQGRFRAARSLVSASISRVGSTVLGTAVLLVGADELARVNVQGADAGVVVDELGWQLGARLRSALVERVPSTTAPTEER